LKPARLTVERRFCGPPEYGNGGYVAGLLFEALVPRGQCAEVTLRRPVPLDTELALRPFERGGGGELVLGDEVLAELRESDLAMEVHPHVDFAEAQRASAGFPLAARFQFRGCFVCGADRAARDGLHIRPGPVPHRTTVAAPWVPDQNLSGETDLVRPRYLWAALDCPGAYALHHAGADQGPLVLGRMTAKLLHPLAAGERCVVAAWPIGADGAKLFAGTALYNQDGWLVALARQTWFPGTGKVPGA
jgi:hypothetical protein